MEEANQAEYGTHLGDAINKKPRGYDIILSLGDVSRVHPGTFRQLDLNR